jgi:small subunit ribosomal protein S13
MSSINIAGVTLPREKIITYALTYVKGIGLTTSKKILAKCGIDPLKRSYDITDLEAAKIRDCIEEMGVLTEGELDRSTRDSIDRLKKSRCLRGLRHEYRLPVRGQRTKTNARTRKGKKKMAVAGKKKPTK